jgi:hypothetical protein
MESEKDTEIYLRKQLEELGGKCWKFTSPMVKGVPDRICFLPDIVWFAEVKSEGKGLDGAQVRRARDLTRLGQRSYMVDTKASVDKMIKIEIRRHQ